jgi:hypothetical protein
MLDNWNRCFPNCEPLGHRLREAFADRWVRFHSLPQSKRYPETEAEYAEVLIRHNAILGELTSPSGQVVLVTTGYSESPVPTRSYPEMEAFDPGAVPWRTLAMHDIEAGFDKPSYWHLFARIREWHPGAFDPLIRFVADDVVANVLVIAPDCRWVLHPYDGGMDVIAESPEARRRLRASHLAWLSARPDGL